jgi:hypothetical protein
MRFHCLHHPNHLKSFCYLNSTKCGRYDIFLSAKIRKLFLRPAACRTSTLLEKNLKSFLLIFLVISTIFRPPLVPYFILILSTLVIPYIHLNILISAAYNFISSFFFMAQQLYSYMVTGFITDL